MPVTGIETLANSVADFIAPNYLVCFPADKSRVKKLEEALSAGGITNESVRDILSSDLMPKLYELTRTKARD